MDGESESDHFSSRNEIVKTIPVIRDWSLNPSCDHGPTVLFERNGKRFFSCSAYRSRKLCPFFMPEGSWKKTSRVTSKSVDGDDNIETEDGKEEVGPSRKRMKADKDCLPFKLPNQRDKGEAQYHFNEKTVKFLMTQLENSGVDSVLCIGTPSLHENIRSSSKKKGSQRLKSFLLDIDPRFAQAFSNDFTLYNMCNHHFFQNREKYEDFLRNSSSLAVILDPPFGVKVELIWNGCLTGVKNDFQQLRGIKDESKKPNENIKMFWIYPYFMEGHILSKSFESGFQMSDFHVEYRNHPKYSGSGKTKSSPIRIFTNVPLSQITLPEDDYRHCELCEKWVDKRNTHCNLCGTCTTKDGGPTYNHCKTCKRCVKPTWKHCSNCGTCHLSDSVGGTCLNQNSTDKIRRNSKNNGFGVKVNFKNHVPSRRSKTQLNYSRKKSKGNEKR